MSWRAQKATIEEVSSDEDEVPFDDDTDLPLPSVPLPTGRGPILQAVGDEDAYAYGLPPGQGRSAQAAPPPFPPMNFGGGGLASPSFTQQYHQAAPPDLSMYKKWVCIYPIAIDAKRAYHAGERRVALEDAVWWPLSKDIADASSRLGLGTLHEVQKCHPRDWANPGRVRVQLKKDNGQPVNPKIKNKKLLLKAVAKYIQAMKPELAPKPETITRHETKPRGKPKAATATPSSTKAGTKGKQKATTKAPQQSEVEKPSHELAALGDFEHMPPMPPPALAMRVSAHSPAVSSGVLVDALKAAMNAPSADAGAAAGGASAAGKGKRKIIRVRQ